MKKAEFIEILRHSLKERKVSDVDEIVAEYDIFFTQKLADGHSEEEIAARLGDPLAISQQFDAESPRPAPGNRTLVASGLALADLFVGLAFLLLFAWVLVMVAGAAAFAGLGGILLLDLQVSGLVPYLPDLIRILFGAVALEAAVLFVIGAEYFRLFVRQLLRSYSRFHRNALARARGEGTLPGIPIYPQIPPAKNRRLRSLALILVAVFVISVLAGYSAAALAAGSLEFWHVWGWFGFP